MEQDEVEQTQATVTNFGKRSYGSKHAKQSRKAVRRPAMDPVFKSNENPVKRGHPTSEQSTSHDYPNTRDEFPILIEPSHYKQQTSNTSEQLSMNCLLNSYVSSQVLKTVY